jgi:hypothetical protein
MVGLWSDCGRSDGALMAADSWVDKGESRQRDFYPGK